jgi:transcriptional regulator with XRE-family HTH domain/DNA-binding CsgD family transcriptional regulator
MTRQRETRTKPQPDDARRRGRMDRSPFAQLLAQARQRRELSQLQLALSANISARHLAFLETGRTRPSARMVTHLAGVLALGEFEEDQLLLAAGYAPRRLPAPSIGGAAWGFRCERKDRPAHETFEAALLLQSVRSAEEAFAVAGAHLAKLGLDHFFAGSLRMRADGVPEITFYRGGRPPLAWLAHYGQCGYRSHDPLVRQTARANGPFAWEEVLARSPLRNAQARRIFAEAGDFRINTGMVIPLRMADGSVRAVSAMAEHLDHHDPALPLSARMVGTALLEALERIDAAPLPPGVRPKLDQEHADLLRWVGQGRSPDWIADRYGLRADEVEKRLMDVSRSLGASDIVQAILRMEAYGLGSATPKSRRSGN